MDTFHDLGEVEETEEYEEYSDEEIDECVQQVGPVKFDMREKEAVKRIEQANLYLSLLNHQLFGENSARPEIIDAVNGEIKEFILSRLEVLLGQKSAVQPAAASVFSPEQTEALKDIANRLIKKDNKPATVAPQIRPLVSAGQAPTVNVTPAIRSVSPPQVAAQPTQQEKPRRGRRPKTIVIREPTPEEGNLGSDGTRYAQATGASRVPMPSNEMMNQMNAAAVAQNTPTGKSGDIGAILQAAIFASQAKNKDITEE